MRLKPVRRMGKSVCEKNEKTPIGWDWSFFVYHFFVWRVDSSVNRTLGNRKTIWEGKQTCESYPRKPRNDLGGEAKA